MRVATLAARTFAAAKKQVRDNSLAGNKRANAGANLLNYAAELVSHNERGHRSRALFPECLELAAAYPTGGDSQQDLSFAGFRVGLVCYLQMKILRIE